MNSTTAAIAHETGGNIYWFLGGCIGVLLLLSLVLFGSVKKDTCCFAVGKYVKIKIMKVFCCRQAVEKNAIELKEIITE